MLVTGVDCCRHLLLCIATCTRHCVGRILIDDLNHIGFEVVTGLYPVHLKLYMSLFSNALHRIYLF